MSDELRTQLDNVQQQLDTLRNEFNEFAYVVSHDMAAPFRQIGGFANIILDKHGANFDGKTMRHFELIIKGSERGSRIIEALLDYSRLITQVPHLSSVDVCHVVEDVLRQLAPTIEERKAEITCNKLPVLEADSDQLNLLFYHLFHNALHYLPPDAHPVVSLDVAENDDCWEFCLKDNGIGVADGQQQVVFTVLRRAVIDKEYEGIGMGLAIAKCVVQQHGGNIWLTSNSGPGCSIHFSLSKWMSKVGGKTSKS